VCLAGHSQPAPRLQARHKSRKVQVISSTVSCADNRAKLATDEMGNLVSFSTPKTDVRNYHDLSALDIDKQEVPFSSLKGKVRRSAALPGQGVHLGHHQAAGPPQGAAQRTSWATLLAAGGGPVAAGMPPLPLRAQCSHPKPGCALP
jgi:hypothetical protein